MKRFIVKLLVLLCLLTVRPAQSIEDELDARLDGLVINQTLTRFGHDFYTRFVTYWSDYQIVMPANLAIYERPSARWGSQIWIEYQGRRIFQQNLGPSTRVIDDIAKIAAARTFALMLQMQIDRNGNKNALEQDDLY